MFVLYILIKSKSLRKKLKLKAEIEKSHVSINKY